MSVLRFFRFLFDIELTPTRWRKTVSSSQCVVFCDQAAKKSAEFKKTKNWYKSVQPALFHMISGKKPGEKREQNKPISTSKSFFRK